jgi:hypothetical protein
MAEFYNVRDEESFATLHAQYPDQVVRVLMTVSSESAGEAVDTRRSVIWRDSIAQDANSADVDSLLSELVLEHSS